VNETTESLLELLLSANLGSEKAEADHLWCANLRRELDAYFPNFPQLPQNYSSYTHQTLAKICKALYERYELYYSNYTINSLMLKASKHSSFMVGCI
jgi:hypothetical protein